MPTRILAHLRRRAAEEDGAIALMTIAFLTFLGMIMVVFLWTIGLAGGAYNTLQGAAQATAYAAVGTVTIDDSAQPHFACQGDRGAPADNGLCNGGRTFQVAEQTLSYALSTSANWGLRYTPGAPAEADTRACSPTRTARVACGIYAFPLAFAPGEAFNLDPQCTGHAVSTSKPEGGRSCWKLFRQEIGEPQYVSGVAVYLTTTVQVPFCQASWCPKQPIQAVAAASQAQDDDPVLRALNAGKGKTADAQTRRTVTFGPCRAPVFSLSC